MGRKHECRLAGCDLLSSNCVPQSRCPRDMLPNLQGESSRWCVRRHKYVKTCLCSQAQVALQTSTSIEFLESLILYYVWAFTVAGGGFWTQWFRTILQSAVTRAPKVCCVTPQHVRRRLPRLTFSRWCNPETGVPKATHKAYFFKRLCVLCIKNSRFCFLFVAFLRALMPGPSLWPTAVTIVNWTLPSHPHIPSKTSG